MSIPISSCRDPHPQGNQWDPSHKAGQIYGEVSGREAERAHLKTISNSLLGSGREGRGMNQHTQLPLKIWPSVKVELCLSQDSTASLLLDRDVQRSHSSSVPCFGKCCKANVDLPSQMRYSTCTPVMQRQPQGNRRPRGHSRTGHCSASCTGS